MKLRNLLLLFFLFILGSTASAQTTFVPADSETDVIDGYKRSYYSEEFGFSLSENSNLSLYDTLSNWIGTPYRFAGNSGRGIDCSGFVTMIYNQVFGKNLGARNSAEIYHKLEKIDPDDLHEGDLVFFRIRKGRISHIGLYLGNNKFIHASTSKGVIISDLDEPYYKKYFAGAGRQHGEINATTTGSVY